MELLYESALLEKTKALIQKVTCTQVFRAALFIIAGKQPKCPSIDEKRCKITGIVPRRIK